MKCCAWTMREIVDIGFTAVDNARDEAGDGPVTRTFDSEIEFQIGAPEHRSKPRLTPLQVAIIRAIWDKKIQQARPMSAPVSDSRRVEIHTGFYPTQLAAEREADLIQSQNPDTGFEYLIERQAGGLHRLQVFRESEKKAGPELLYNLELDAEELSALHQLFQLLSDPRFGPQVREITDVDKSIQDKVLRLMEGR